MPLSERNQGETDSASASVKAQKQVSVFFDYQNKHISNRDEMIRFFEDHQSKKRKTMEHSNKFKVSQEVNALLDKDYKNTQSNRKRNAELKRCDSKRSEDKPEEDQVKRRDSGKQVTETEAALLQSQAAKAAKPSLGDKPIRGVSINSMSTKGASVLSGTQQGSGLFGSRKPGQKPKVSASALQSASIKR